MKSKLSGLLLLFLISSTFIQAQTYTDTIKTKDHSLFVGKIISEQGDSIKLETENFGIIGIAKDQIVHHGLVSIETKDGNSFNGKIIKENLNSIVIKTETLGEITIPKIDITSQKNIQSEQIKDGKLWFTNPQSTRYFWSPNAFGLKKGEGYYQNIWVLWNQFSYGITDHLSVGAGIIPTFLFAGAPTPIFGTLKFSFPVDEKFHVGGGAIAGTVLGDGTGLGIVFGLTTFGTPDNNFTIGAGYGYAGGSWATAPIINLNGMFRVSSRGYFITENYITSEGVLLMIGGRRIIKKAGIDFGLVIPLTEGMGTFVAVPWLGFTVPFGNKVEY